MRQGISKPLMTVLLVSATISVGAHFESIAPTSNPLIFSPQIIPLLASSLFTALTLEQVFPLQSVDKLLWIYHHRPTSILGAIRTIDGMQLITVACGGAILGSTLNAMAVSALLALTFRIGVALPLRSSLPPLLKAGHKRAVTKASLNIMDSTVARESMASAQLRWIIFPATSNRVKLALYRIARIPFIWLSSLSIFTTYLAIGPSFTEESLIFFVVSSAFLGVFIAYTSDFSKFFPSTSKHRSALFKRLSVAIYSVFVATIATLPTDPQSLLSLVILSASIWRFVTVRSKDRSVSSISYIDSGFLGQFSPEVFSYLTEGFTVLSLGILASIFIA